jgi:NADH dehydrogenase [ubiquinone] 1 alpha subcomplex assembly factor 7
LAIVWHETLDQVPDGPAMVIANEFLDALPIRQLVFLDGVWRERVIESDAQGDLRFAAGPRVDFEPEGRPEPGAIVELRAGEDELLGQLAKRRAPLVALSSTMVRQSPLMATRCRRCAGMLTSIR